MDDPLITVIIPLYNHENYIRDTIRSVLNQSFEKIEVIIIDDGSQDRSAAEATAVHDERISFYSQSNHGAHHAINRGIELAGGKYIAVLNSDDLYLPDRLAKCFTYLEKETGVDAVFTKVEAIDAEGNHLYYFSHEPSCKNHDLRSHPDQIIALDLLGVNPTTTTSNLFCRREIFSEVGMFRNFRYCHDLDWLLRFVSRKHARFIAEPLLKYRFHGANTIKEDVGAICFEVGLVIKDFMTRQDLATLFPDVEESRMATEIYRSLQFPNIDRMLAVLGLVGCDQREWPVMMERLQEDSNDSFRRQAVLHIRRWFEEDKNREVAKQENTRLNEELKRLREENEMYRRSISRKIGRGVTWPLRKVLGHLK